MMKMMSMIVFEGMEGEMIHYRVVRYRPELGRCRKGIEGADMDYGLYS